MKKQKERYEPMNEFSSDSAGDPAEHGFPTIMEEPSKQFSDPWIVISNQTESPIGKVFTFTGGQMTLVRDEKRRAIGIKNAFGKIRWISMDEAPFGSDQISTTIVLPPYRESGLASENTPLAHVLQKSTSRAPKFSIEEQVTARGGDNTHKSIFKPQFGRHGERIR